jgi:AcrR family transcriptional regulator
LQEPSEKPGTRERIIAEAEVLLLQGGYSAMSLEAVAQAVGIRKPSLYHHFPNGKEELFVAIAEARTACDEKLISSRLANRTDVVGRLQALARHFADCAGYRPYRAIMDSTSALPVERGDYVRKLIVDRVEKPVRDVIAFGLEEGTLGNEDPELAIRIFLNLLLVIASFDNDPHAEGLPERIVAFYLRGLGSALAPEVGS